MDCGSTLSNTAYDAWLTVGTLTTRLAEDNVVSLFLYTSRLYFAA